jgi:hypothetical protein
LCLYPEFNARSNGIGITSSDEVKGGEIIGSGLRHSDPPTPLKRGQLMFASF